MSERKPSADTIEAIQHHRFTSGAHAGKGGQALRKKREREKIEARIDAVLDAITFPEDEL